MLYDANPVFAAPPSVQVREAIAKIPYIASFGSFLDETSGLADLILPDHAPLESWLDDVPESGAAGMVASLAPPAVHPLHDTRAMPDVLLDLARGLGGGVAAALPWKTFDEMLRASFVPLRQHGGSIAATADDDEFLGQGAGARRLVERTGAAKTAAATAPSSAASHAPVKLADPQFDGGAGAFPFYFLALRFPGVSRRLARAPAVAAGNARRAHHRDVVELD